MTKTFVVSASGQVTDKDAYLYSLTVTAGIDAAQVRVREKDGTGPVKAELKTPADSTSQLLFQGVIMPGGIYVEIVSGTSPSVTVEFA